MNEPIVCGGLPDLDDAEGRAFYDRAFANLAPIRVRGFYGAAAGGPASPDDAVIFLYEADPHEPTLALTMAKSDMVRFADALADLVKRFRQH